MTPTVESRKPSTRGTTRKTAAPLASPPISPQSSSSQPARKPPRRGANRRIVESDSESEDSWENIEPPSASDIPPASPLSPAQTHRGKPLFLDSASDSDEASVANMLAPSDEEEEAENDEKGTRAASPPRSPSPVPAGKRTAAKARVKGRIIQSDSESEDSDFETNVSGPSQAKEQESAAFRLAPRTKRVIDISSDESESEGNVRRTAQASVG